MLSARAGGDHRGAGGADRSVVTCCGGRCTPRRCAHVRINRSGKVTVMTFGKQAIKLRLRLSAPATAGFEAFAFAKAWNVK